MSRRRQRRREAKAQRHAPPPGTAARVVVREAGWVERLAYTQTQAAEVLGISRSTFYRRILPYVETIQIGSGARLIPIDELERFLAERRQAARRLAGPPKRSGRRLAVPAEVVERIRAARAAGKSFAQIAHDLDAELIPTAHGGSRWWPSTIRAVLLRRIGQ